MCNGGQVLISITQALNRGGGRTTEECEITHDQGDDRLTVIFPVESVTAQWPVPYCLMTDIQGCKECKEFDQSH